MWTDSEEDDVNNQAEIQVPLPFEESWDARTIRQAAALFVKHFVMALQKLELETVRRSGSSSDTTISGVEELELIQKRSVAFLQRLLDTRFPRFDLQKYSPLLPFFSCSSVLAVDMAKIEQRASLVAEYFQFISLVNPASNASSLNEEMLATKEFYVFGYVESVWEIALGFHNQLDDLVYCIRMMLTNCW
jgi:hypothetical protein